MLTNLLADLRRGYFFRRHADTILRIVVILTPFFLVAAAATVNSNKNRVEDWLPSSFRETTELKWFREHFPTDQFLVLSWEGCQLGGDPSVADAPADDPRIEKLAALLRGNESAGTDDGHGYSHYFKEVTTARDVLAKMTSPPTELPYEEAVNRLKGSLVGPDGRQTCLVISLTEDGQADLRGTIGRGDKGVFRVRRKPGILYRAMASAELDVSEVRLVGPTVDNVSIDEEGERTLVRLASLAGALGLGLSYWSLRNVRLTLIVFTCGVLSAMLGLALVSIFGQEADAVLMSMPALVYVLAISGAVHLVNYYREAMVEEGPHRAPMKAILLGWKPALLCSITTAVGLGSLYASDLAPIRKFGVFSAIGVMGTLAILFIFLPAALQRFPEYPRRRPIDESDPSSDSGSDAGELAHGMLDRVWQLVGGWIVRHHAFVAISCVLLIAFTGYGVTYVRTSIDLLKLFDRRARILSDYAWMESHLGRLVPMELVVRFPSEVMADRATAEVPGSQVAGAQKYTFLERMEAIQHIKREIEVRFGAQGQDVLGRAMSAATFAPILPDSKGSAVQYARRSATNRQLEDSIDAFKASGYLQSEGPEGAELWRISLGVAAFKNLDYGQFTGDLHACVEPMLDVISLRGDVLRAVQSKHDDTTGRGSVAKVLIWNAAQSPQATVAAVNAGTKPNDLASTTVLSALGSFVGPLAAVHPAESHDKASTKHHDLAMASPEDISRQRILQELLSARRLRVESGQRRAEEASQALTDKQIKGLKKYDCVVVLGGLTDEQFDEWREAGISVIDGRYEAGGNSREPVAAGAQDATSVRGLMASANPTPAISAVYTGVVPIVYKAQRALLSSLIESTFWSFATITPLMMFVARSVAAGSVVMLPNALPVLVVFGGMGWLGIPVDIGSMMSASIALGVAVDDTIHFLTWFRADL
ncbi:MAG: MMPL family transporter, partial [Planctomycetota bacterium]|nr:MMPL family transporter [Planctomycetota bacterium]